MLALHPDALGKRVDRQLPDRLPTWEDDRAKEAVLVELRPEPLLLPGGAGWLRPTRGGQLQLRRTWRSAGRSYGRL